MKQPLADAMTALKIILSILIGIAGLGKLAGARPLAKQFAEFGLPKAMMYVVGILEVLAAIGLWLVPLTFWSATGVVLLMLGAIASHVKARHGVGQTAPSILIMTLAGLVAYNSLDSVYQFWKG